MKKLLNLIVLLSFAVFISTSSTFADESLLNQPAPESAHDIPSPFDQGFEVEPARERPVLDAIKNSELTLKLRNFYFNRGKPTAIDSYAWAQGGSIEHKLGRIAGIFDMSTEYFGSFPLEAPEDHDGTLILEPGQDEISALGVLNPRATFANQVLSVYRQKYNLPYVNEQDSRMVPNTFEGYTIAMPKTNNETFQYVAGYIDRVKKRESDVFVPMSEAEGAGDTSHGLFIAGARYFIIPELFIAAIDNHVEDGLNIFYGEAIHKSKFTDKIENALSVQYSSQESVGDNLVRGDDYSGSMWGIQNAVSYEGIVAKIAVNVNDSGALLRAPFGSYPGYNSSVVEDFNRAGESSWQLGLSYDFKRVDVEGLSITTAYIQGNGAVDEITKANLNDKDESDVTIDYKVPKEFLLRRFWFRLRGAIIEEENVSGNTEDYRVIVNYDIPLWTASDTPSP